MFLYASSIEKLRELDLYEVAKDDKDDTTIPQTIASEPVQQEDKKVEVKDLGYSVKSDPSGEKLESEPPAANTMFDTENQNINEQNTDINTSQTKVEDISVENTQIAQNQTQTENPDIVHVDVVPQVNNENKSLVNQAINKTEEQLIPVQNQINQIDNGNTNQNTINVLPQTTPLQIFPEDNSNSENINEPKPQIEQTGGLGNTLMNVNNQNNLFDNENSSENNINNNTIQNENNISKPTQGIINTFSVDDILNGQG